MHVLMPVFFVAPHGGLHEHVLSLVDGVCSVGWDCTVACKPGAFADRASALGASVVLTDFAQVDEATRLVCDAGTYDLVHAHPFASREVGLRVAQAQRIPLILTIHGMYDDELPSYIARTTLVLCVSEAVRDHLIKLGVPPQRLRVARNSVDTGLFSPHPPAAQLRGPSGQYGSLPATDANRPLVVVVTPLREDKRFIVSCVEDAWKSGRFARSPDWDWWVVGDGPLREHLESTAAKYNNRAGRKAISFLGWRDLSELPHIYRAAQVAVALGRSALEAMACGVPTVAVGSRAYIGFLDFEGTVQGTYSNFGGVGGKASTYSPGRIRKDIQLALDCGPKRLARFYSETIALDFDQAEAGRLMRATYLWAASAPLP